MEPLKANVMCFLMSLAHWPFIGIFLVPTAWIGKQAQNFCYRGIKAVGKHSVLIPWNGSVCWDHDCWMGWDGKNIWMYCIKFSHLFYSDSFDMYFLSVVGPWTILCGQWRRKAQRNTIFSWIWFTLCLWCPG